MQGKDITKSTFSQLFKPITGNDFLKTLNVLEADKYLKKLNTSSLLN